MIIAFIVLGIALFATPIIILTSLNNIRNNDNPNPSSNVVLADDGDVSSAPVSVSPAVTGIADDGFRYNYTQIIAAVKISLR